MEWSPITGRGSTGPRDALYVAGTEVSRVVRREDGGWFALLRYPGRNPVRRDCTSEASGRAGCEAWAMRHMAILRTDAERRHLEWLSKQTWRGEDCCAAAETLARRSE